MAKKDTDPEKIYAAYRVDYDKTENAKQIAELFPEGELNAILGTFTLTLLQNAGTDPQKWQVTDIKSAMEGVFIAFKSNLSNISETDLQGYYRDLYVPLNDFVVFIVNKIATGLNHSDMATAFIDIESTYGVGEGSYVDDGGNVDLVGFSAPEYDTEYTMDVKYKKRGIGNHTEWQEYRAKDINHYVSDWLTEFFTSPEWQALPDSITQEDAILYVTEMTFDAYDEFHSSPKNWGVPVIKMVLTDHFVHQVIIQPDQYSTIVPTLTAFFTFAKRAGYIRAVQADKTIKTIKGVEADMIEAGQDRDKYSETKKMWLDMAAAGISRENREAAETFIATWIENQQAARAGSQFMDYERNLVYQPEDDYVNMPHPDPVGKHHWTKAVATRNHDDLARYAWTMWSLPANQDLHAELNEADFVDFIVFFGDVMYAQFLETILHWDAQSAHVVFSGYDAAEQPESFELLRETLKRLVDHLMTEGKLTRPVGEEIRAVFDAAPLTPKSQAKSNVVSMDEARKRLKNKKD
ncbi:hypothetical protein AYR62_09010 [Secundilactobacillus paracollinoides]|uniref:hypothetical protein n=1 Tax=Secundilactobacillus paracollinoides TaxID=240427 RepID=UPI00081A96DD|nr:hypothetical protein [Secundilactobacillus paracollinoides]ANZ64196.1 hypothetical protein AYR62_09010 [Secundilactobacillus paracollinoides]